VGILKISIKVYGDVLETYLEDNGLEIEKKNV